MNLLTGDGERTHLLVGLTGGIATGKSTVAGMLRELGAPVIDADAIVHELLSSGGGAVKPLVAAFGTGVQAPDGSIDRKALGKRAFNDDDVRARLESIVHPLVAARSRELLAEAASSSDSPMIFYDAALLIESGRDSEFDRIVVVYASAEQQLSRLIERDQLDVDQAGARIRAQLPLEHKLEHADYVIDNSSHWQHTRHQVAEVHRLLLEDAVCRRAGEELPERSPTLG